MTANPSPGANPPDISVVVSRAIFKAYDIRGVVDKTLTEDTVRRIGLALAEKIRGHGLHQCVVGRDGRLSGPRLQAALSEGLVSGGVDVIDIGCVPTPVVYFATHFLKTGTGVAITGSHNPPQYNGLKMMVAGSTLAGEEIQGLYQSIVAAAKAPLQGGSYAGPRGGISAQDVVPAYRDRILSDVRLARPLRIGVDCGNGVAGAIAPALIAELGCTVVPLFCEVDGNFPNHHPDPADPHNLEDLIRAVKDQDLDLGLAFDGDGDRLGVVTRKGEIIWPDRQLMLYAADVLAQRPGGQIIYDVKCTRHLASWIQDHGGQALMWRTGHSLIKAKLKETGAPLAGEMSGHIFFNDRWFGFDDGLYTAARLLEILSRVEDPSSTLHALPNATSTPELQIKTKEGENYTLVDLLKNKADFPTSRERILIDGIRVEYEDGFGLARPSNTTPVVVLRFEADNAAALARIQAEFRAVLTHLAPGLVLPF
ncbi:MAG: phosphomannomutase/phosphoglucomutase [Betaproteobacteria bacterium]|nr:phosphomannomutase/phosphoglucomutase [Betaproteobacteria bacterium]